jgi:hypothetical protein
MKTEVKTQVVAALRSGKYPQDLTFYCSLRTLDDCYCVMGVVADIVDPDGWERPADRGCYVHRDRTADLRDDVRDAAGLTDASMWSLITLNDRKTSFSDLADHIEKNL